VSRPGTNGKGGPVTDSTAPNADGVADSQSDVYLSNLSDEDRAIFLRSSGNPDLEAEIRLLRTVITSLLANLRNNYRHFAVLFNALCRTIGLQIKSRAGREDVEEAILEAAEDALQELESEARQGSADPERLA
jgi:hypothetical protein